ncbi:MAG: 3-methyl-2-oxobutanoate hydroxymethyltransferase [Rhodobacteraceae bacterium]|nr:3-methyl-2-oxobutanoate hydroxymethyltransferase [Paracoccaceae bacterium]
MATRRRLTVADIRALKGVRQLTMMRVETWQELAAAEAAGIDSVSVPPAMMTDPRFRDVAPGVFAVPGVNFFELGTADDFVRWAFAMLRAGADAVYCSASYATVEALARENVPVIGHVGLIPSRATWTGGFRAVGKTAESALSVWNAVKAYESAGAFGAEIEVVPAEVAAEISRRTHLFMVSMGAGAGCDCQYLFATDVLGTNRGHIPRHARVYRNLAKMEDRMQKERIAAFREYVADVASGAFPAESEILSIDAKELAAFRKALG